MKAPTLPAPLPSPIDHDADREPVSDIELLGAMLTDNVTLGILLRALPYERTHYRSNLRTVAGAAIRIRRGCEKLLGEVDPRAEQLATTEAVHVAGYSSVVPEIPADVQPGQVIHVDEVRAPAESEPVKNGNYIFQSLHFSLVIGEGLSYY